MSYSLSLEPKKKPKDCACQECGKAFNPSTTRKGTFTPIAGRSRSTAPAATDASTTVGTCLNTMLIHHLWLECGTGISERGNLSRHRAHIHGSMPKSECEDCGKTYIEKGGLDRHIRSGACSATRKT